MWVSTSLDRFEPIPTYQSQVKIKSLAWQSCSGCLPCCSRPCGHGWYIFCKSPIKVDIMPSNDISTTNIIKMGFWSIFGDLWASLWSSNCVLVVSLVAIGGHEGTVEGVHPSTLVIPHPEPDNDWVRSDRKQIVTVHRYQQLASSKQSFWQRCQDSIPGFTLDPILSW